MIFYLDQVAAWALSMQSILAQVAIIPIALGVLYLLLATRRD
jgi:hypothetical protein